MGDTLFWLAVALGAGTAMRGAAADTDGAADGTAEVTVAELGMASGLAVTATRVGAAATDEAATAGVFEAGRAVVTALVGATFATGALVAVAGDETVAAGLAEADVTPAGRPTASVVVLDLLPPVVLAITTMAMMAIAPTMPTISGSPPRREGGGELGRRAAALPAVAAPGRRGG
jgi:hypothetical protein